MNKQVMYSSTFHPGSQGGAVLVFSLIILLLLTIIGVSGMRATVMQERMTGNDRDRGSSFQIAEAGLRDAELYLASPVIGSFSTLTNTDGLYVAKTDGTSWWKGSLGNTVWSSGAVTGSLAGAQYIIEELQTIIGSDGSLEAGVPGADIYYRVSSRGELGVSKAIVILQSIYKR